MASETYSRSPGEMEGDSSEVESTPMTAARRGRGSRQTSSGSASWASRRLAWRTLACSSARGIWTGW